MNNAALLYLEILKTIIMETNLKIVSRLKNFLVHSYHNGALFVSSRNKVFKIINLEKPRPELINSIHLNRLHEIFKVRALDRILKNDIRLLKGLKNNTYIVCNKNGWWFFDGLNTLHRVKGLSSTQPLSRGICQTKNGITYIGEYSQNPKRKDVRIFRSTDNINFKIVYTFKSSSIRHIHALITDHEETNRIWILTGDLDHESHIYFTDDDFMSIKIFLSQGQISRATDLIIDKDNIFWGTDSPTKQNYFIRANKKNPLEYIKIFPLPGPVYYLSRNDAGGKYVATTAEPGRAAEKKIARIFSFMESSKVTEKIVLKKDIFPQHGIIYFPSGILPDNYVIFSQRALKPYEGYMTIAKDYEL